MADGKNGNYVHIDENDDGTCTMTMQLDDEDDFTVLIAMRIRDFAPYASMSGADAHEAIGEMTTVIPNAPPEF